MPAGGLYSSFRRYAPGLRAVTSFGVFCMLCCVTGFAYVHVQMCIRAQTHYACELQNTGATISPGRVHVCLFVCVCGCVSGTEILFCTWLVSIMGVKPVARQSNTNESVSMYSLPSCKVLISI